MAMFNEFGMLPDMPPGCKAPNLHELAQMGSGNTTGDINATHIGWSLQDLYPHQLNAAASTKAKTVERAASVHPTNLPSKPTPRPRGVASGRQSTGPATFTGLTELFLNAPPPPAITKSISLPVAASTAASEVAEAMDIDDDDAAGKLTILVVMELF